jgi:hypothetical protein
VLVVDAFVAPDCLLPVVQCRLSRRNRGADVGDHLVVVAAEVLGPVDARYGFAALATTGSAEVCVLVVLDYR